jgi:hypothetical protein
MDWAQVLVIILAVFLGLFLLLGIVLVIMLIKVTQQIRSVAGSAERTLKVFEKTLSQASWFASPLVAIKMIRKFFKKHQSKGHGYDNQE